MAWRPIKHHAHAITLTSSISGNDKSVLIRSLKSMPAYIDDSEQYRSAEAKN
jgi:hypothetical protein